MFGYKSKIVGHLAEEHLGDLDPVVAVWRGQHGFEVVAPDELRDTLVHSLWRLLEDSDGNVSVQKGQPFEQKSSENMRNHQILNLLLTVT